MRYSREEWSIEAGRVKGREDPTWLLERPEIYPIEAVYLQAFWDLSTERQGGMTVGRIPWSVARRYFAEVVRWSSPMWDVFWRILVSLDNAYLQYQKDEYEQNRPRPKASRPDPGGFRKERRTYGR